MEWQKKFLGLDCHCPQIHGLADEAMDFCMRWFRNETNRSLLVIVGDSGTGKTMTARGILKFSRLAAFRGYELGFWKSPPSIDYLRWPEVIDSSESGQVELPVNSSLLIIDDAGAESDRFRKSTDRLCQILSRRERAFTVFTTNIRPDAWGAKFDHRVADRMFRNSVIVDLTNVPSYSMKF